MEVVGPKYLGGGSKRKTVTTRLEDRGTVEERTHTEGRGGSATLRRKFLLLFCSPEIK